MIKAHHSSLQRQLLWVFQGYSVGPWIHSPVGHQYPAKRHPPTFSMLTNTKPSKQHSTITVESSNILQKSKKSEVSPFGLQLPRPSWSDSLSTKSDCILGDMCPHKLQGSSTICNCKLNQSHHRKNAQHRVHPWQQFPPEQSFMQTVISSPGCCVWVELVQDINSVRGLSPDAWPCP